MQDRETLHAFACINLHTTLRRHTVISLIGNRTKVLSNQTFNLFLKSISQEFKHAGVTT